MVRQLAMATALALAVALCSGCGDSGAAEAEAAASPELDPHFRLLTPQDLCDVLGATDPAAFTVTTERLAGGRVTSVRFFGAGTATLRAAYKLERVGDLDADRAACVARASHNHAAVEPVPRLGRRAFRYEPPRRYALPKVIVFWHPASGLRVNVLAFSMSDAQALTLARRIRRRLR